MNTDLHNASKQYVGIVNGELVCHTGVIQVPMKKGVKRVHRLVVLPDYQGIGIGTKFITEIARLYYEKGYKFNLITTTPALVHSLAKHKNWKLLRYGHDKGTITKLNDFAHLKNSTSIKRVTYSFYYSE